MRRQLPLRRLAQESVKSDLTAVLPARQSIGIMISIATPIEDASPEIGLLILFAAGFLVYFLPTIIAAATSNRNTLAIAALNLLLGWTFLGWVAALVWSLASIRSE